MEYERYLFISPKYIHIAATNKNFCNALAFVISIKAAHTNSMLLNYSWKSITKLLHCNMYKAREVRDNALDYGLIRLEGKTGGEHIVANKLTDKRKERCVKFHVHYNEDGSFHIYIKANGHNKTKFEQQTLSDISDVIREAAFLKFADGYNHKLNIWQRNVIEHKALCQYLDISKGRDIRGKNYDINKNGKTNPSNRGYSQEKIVNNVFNNTISVYQLRKLIAKMKKEKLLRIEHHHIEQIRYDMDAPASDIDDFRFLDERTKTYRYDIVCFRQRYEEEAVYIRKLADSYRGTADYSKWHKDWKLIHKTRKGKVAA